MLKALLYLNADLASSIALRYACHLAYVMDMEITPFHVTSDRSESRTPGTGWVRRTWENGLIQQAREEITGLIQTEKMICPELKSPTIRLGKPENELLSEVSGRFYDLFIIGLLHTFSARQFHERIQSRFYRKSRCPILLVKNVIDLKRVAILVDPVRGGESEARTFNHLIGALPVEIDLLSCVFRKADNGRSERLIQTRISEPETDRESVAINVLREKRLAPDNIFRIEGTPDTIGARLADYHMVVTSFPGETGPASPLIECLSRVPSAMLFCRD